jgi:molybdopterin adenylyltransferase
VIGLISVSDRASAGVYADLGLPGLQQWLARAMKSRWRAIERLVADERGAIEAALIELVDDHGCHLVLTTGGTGPAPRDVTPEATLAVATRQMPGFGEQMRRISLEFVPTAILSRQVGVLREVARAGGTHAALILNLPGQPKAIAETLEGLRDAQGRIVVPGIFAAVPYCIQLIGGPYVETHSEVVVAHRPKSALRAPE